MFGSKIRSWMENHIGRPRKKGNKHKQQQQQQQQQLANGATSSGGFGVSNAYETSSKRTGVHGNIKCNLPTSPVLGSSGHGSGNHSGYASPVRRREVSPIQCHTQSRYGWQSPDQDTTITSPKSDNLLYAPQRYQHPQQLTVHTAPNSKHNSSADKSPAKVNCSSSSISSLSWSTGSKEPNSTNSKKVELELAPVVPVPVPTPVTVPPPVPVPMTAPQQDYEYHKLSATTMRHNNFAAEIEIHKHDTEEADYEEVGVHLREHTNFSAYQRPHSENFMHYMCEPTAVTHAHDDVDLVPRYGRLLPSKLPAQSSDSVESLHVQSECLPATGGGFGRLRKPRAGLRSNNFMPATAPNVAAPNPPGRSPLGLAAPHSLSSPESAYSTGYSTDGTSPCAANYNPPEYYINMRTGTHYFPKSINSLAIEAQRYKFGLNRIEEMSPLDPLPKTNFGHTLVQPTPIAQQATRLECRSPLALHTQKLYESPSPRQRCRIRTNPFFGMQHHPPPAATMPLQTLNAANGLQTGTLHMQNDDISAATASESATSSSLGLHKSSHEFMAHTKQNGKLKAEKLTTTTTTATATHAYASSASSSSLTEVENAPHTTIKRKHFELMSPNSSQQQQLMQDTQVKQQQQGQQQQQQQQNKRLECQDTLNSDDEATLNEMFGKFDESYIYEKETDIISSDSATDATDCPSEIDTGQDAGDECETDELLDIDFIDTSSMQEVVCDKRDQQRNLGSCSYYTNNASPTRQRRRKRFQKTRKKSVEQRDKLHIGALPRARESRSVGGTPVCLRRNPQLAGKERIYKTSPLSQRANSLIFTGTEMPQHFMTIAESEKALLKADLEADMKYRQLIMEAESLLESMKNSLQSIPRDTPVASPRRLNPLNKRVEMLKHSEVENKKQNTPQSQQPQSQQYQQPPPNTQKEHLEHELAAAINKRIELLKFETSSAPNSPRLSRCSPRKTHLTNFINQNAPPPAPVPAPTELYKPPLSPQLQLNGRSFCEANARVTSPCTPRRVRSSRRARVSGTNNLNGSESELEDLVNHNYLPEQEQEQYKYNNADYNNQNVLHTQTQSQSQIQAQSYCPHSEPLKRKVYKGSSSFERIKKSFDLELEISKQAKLQTASTKCSMQDICAASEILDGGNAATKGPNRKQQILLSTIVDLKRSLEHQSYQLSGLNGE